MNKLPLDVTDQLIGLFLLNLSSVGEAIPKSVLRHWCRNTSVPSIVLNPDGFTSARSFARAYQAVSLLKKYPYGSGVSDGIRRQRAIDKFLDRDAECARTSINFCNRSFSPKDFTSLCVARDFVHKVLGEFSWDDALPHCDFGPGASIGVPRRQRHKANKIGKRYPTVTGPCHELLKAYMAWAPQIGRAVKSPRVVDGNVVTTVPKNAEIDRVIATEPLWNMFFQKGIGGLISHRLGRIGLHIPTQQGKNREMARLGSLYGTYATLDLSAASDSVSMELVRFMVPSSWWDAFVITRSPYSEVDGRKVFLRKIASMGNGYCFELETILFLALAYAVSPYNSRSVNVDVAAYGDDIIVRPEVASELTHLLGVAGFKLNPEKSFITGPFRESCGGHFFDGFDVTPIMLDEQVRTANDLFVFCNQVRRWASRLGESLYCDALVQECYDFAVKRIPGRLRRCRIPPGSGDDGLMSSFEEACPSSYFDKSVGMVDGWRYLAFGRLPRKKKMSGLRPILMTLYEYERSKVQLLPQGNHDFLWVHPYCANGRDYVMQACQREVGFSLRLQVRQWRGQWEWLGPWV